MSPGALLSDPAPLAKRASSTIESVDIGGGRWFIPVIQQERVNPMPTTASGLLLGGLLLSFLLFVITRAQVRAWAVAVRHEAELRALVQRDVLTGLPNRAILGEHLSRAIALARRHVHQLAVLFMDVDRFKDINDSLGHAIGDQVLQQIGGRLLACVRSSDTVSRQGGDEFVLLLSEVTHAEDAGHRTQHIINALALPYTVTYHEIHITVSVGISVYPNDGEDAATLMRAADTAMYQAKERGRNNYQFFTPEMNTRTVERLWIEGGLRRALARQELAMRYQPTVNLQTGTITGAEALLRWVHPIRGIVNPLDFIPVAEHCGLIVPIGEWVLQTACAQARAWLEAGFPMPVAVNVSALEFRDSRFLERIAATLQESQLDARYLKLELTESVLMQHAASTVSVLDALKRMGVTIAVDDFGTGYSSLSYLRQFPIDELKVDQSFVQEIASDGGGAAIVSAIISMGQSLRLRVIAEGVETREQLNFLQTQGCGEGQGFYFSRPVTADQFAEIAKCASTSKVSPWAPTDASAGISP